MRKYSEIKKDAKMALRCVNWLNSQLNKVEQEVEALLGKRRSKKNKEQLETALKTYRGLLNKAVFETSNIDGLLDEIDGK
jgi:hypothetical protein